MNIIYVCAIMSVLLLLVFTALSFALSGNVKIQVAYIVVASCCIGMISSLILVNYSTKSAIIWPCLFMVHVVSKAIDLVKNLRG